MRQPSKYVTLAVGVLCMYTSSALCAVQEYVLLCLVKAQGIAQMVIELFQTRSPIMTNKVDCQKVRDVGAQGFKHTSFFWKRLAGDRWRLQPAAWVRRRAVGTGQVSCRRHEADEVQ
ncbi:hypothetical protein BD289DRAFT_51414 [Coniella lustricola]|uniref:Uncharacterized protein n=1 Tax=Coniella lustricola TaxID=2025994 RepID=A0A2T3A198_9PEZI|nr:hypothetical protein BD289DRAFT_51414 [Coniella lustricola]